MMPRPGPHTSRLRAEIPAGLLLAFALSLGRLLAQDLPAPPEPAHVAAQMESGRTAFEKGQYAQALTEFQAIAKAQPKNRYAQLLAGVAAYWAREPEKALACWDSLADTTRPNSPEEWQLACHRAMALNALGRTDAADRAVEHVYELRRTQRSEPALTAKGFTREHFWCATRRVGVWEVFDERGEQTRAWRFNVTDTADPEGALTVLSLEPAPTPVAWRAYALVQEDEQARRVFFRWPARPAYAEARQRAMEVLQGQRQPIETIVRTPPPAPQPKVVEPPAVTLPPVTPPQPAPPAEPAPPVVVPVTPPQPAQLPPVVVPVTPQPPAPPVEPKTPPEPPAPPPPEAQPPQAVEQPRPPEQPSPVEPPLLRPVEVPATPKPPAKPAPPEPAPQTQAAPPKAVEETAPAAPAKAQPVKPEPPAEPAPQPQAAPPKAQPPPEEKPQPQPGAGPAAPVPQAVQPEPAGAPAPGQTPAKRELTPAEQKRMAGVKALTTEPGVERILAVAARLADVEFDLFHYTQLSLHNPDAAQRFEAEQLSGPHPWARDDAALLVGLLSRAAPQEAASAFGLMDNVLVGGKADYARFALLTAINTRGGPMPEACVTSCLSAGDTLVRQTAALMLARAGRVAGLRVLFRELARAKARAQPDYADQVARLVGGALDELLGNVFGQCPADPRQSTQAWRAAAAKWWADNEARVKHVPDAAPGQPLWKVQP